MAHLHCRREQPGLFLHITHSTHPVLQPCCTHSLLPKAVTQSHSSHPPIAIHVHPIPQQATYSVELISRGHSLLLLTSRALPTKLSFTCGIPELSPKPTLFLRLAEGPVLYQVPPGAAGAGAEHCPQQLYISPQLTSLNTRGVLSPTTSTAGPPENCLFQLFSPCRSCFKVKEKNKDPKT